MAQMQFDATQVAPDSGLPDPVPTDWYNAMIDESQMKPTKSGTGTYLQLRYTILDERYKNRKVYQRLNIRNDNAQTQEIAYGHLSAICHATKVMQLNDSSQLHNIPVKIKVKYVPGDGTHDASNDIASVQDANYVVDKAQAETGAQQQPQQQFQQPQQQQPQQNQGQQFQQPAQQPQQQFQQPQQQPQQDQQTWQQPQAEQPWQQPQNNQAQQPQQQQPQQQNQNMQQPQDNSGMPPWAQGQ